MKAKPKHHSNGVKYSVVLPVFNEESCIEEVLERVDTALKSLHAPYEIICIDDCSTDRSWCIISDLHSKKTYLKGIRFLRNFGHQYAVYAGIRNCSGEYIAVLDSDGQDPPEVLPELFRKCQEGYDVVYAVRRRRKEHLLKRIAYHLFYRFYRRIVPFNAPLDSGDFSVFTKNVAEFIRSTNDKNPFIRGLRSWYGGKQIGYEYERARRLSGPPKYSLRSLVLLAYNASISFSKIPLRFIALTGMAISGISFFIGLMITIIKLFVGIEEIGWTSIALLIIFFGGLQLFVLGIIGEYIGNIFDEAKNRPPYLIAQTIGIFKFSPRKWHGKMQ